MMKMRRIIKGVTKHFTTQFDFDEVSLLFLVARSMLQSAHIFSILAEIYSNGVVMKLFAVL